MKTKILVGLLLFATSTAYSMLWEGCVFTKLAVNNDGTWSATILPNNGLPDSLFLVSGTDTAKYLFKNVNIFDCKYPYILVNDSNESIITSKTS